MLVESTVSPLIVIIKALTIVSAFGRNGNVAFKFTNVTVVDPSYSDFRLRSLMSITQQMLDNWFTYHAPSDKDQVSYNAIRDAAKVLAETIVRHSPSSADQTAAIRLLREAVMTANASIACKGM